MQNKVLSILQYCAVYISGRLDKTLAGIGFRKMQACKNQYIALLMNGK